MVSRAAKQLVRLQLRDFGRRNQQSATPTLFTQLVCGAPVSPACLPICLPICPSLIVSLSLPVCVCMSVCVSEYLNVFTGHSAVADAVFQQTLFSQTRQRFGDIAVAPSEKRNLLRVTAITT